MLSDVIKYLNFFFIIFPTWNTFQSISTCTRCLVIPLSAATNLHVSCASVFLSTEAAGWRIRVSPRPPPLPYCQSDYPGLEPRTLLPLPCRPPPLTPSDPHAHTLKCTVCKSAPRGAAHLFSESPPSPDPTPTTKPKQLKPTQCVTQPCKIKDKYDQMTN